MNRKPLAAVLYFCIGFAIAGEICPTQPLQFYSSPSEDADVLFIGLPSDAFDVISPFQIVQPWCELKLVNGSRAGMTGWARSEFFLPCTLPKQASELLTYSRSDAVAYAYQWWSGANHQCSSAYTSCTPWSYWGEESCGYPSHGGDCADFVSQCLIAGGHPYLNQGSPCRGYPCGKEEIGAKNIGDCLANVHGWRRTCGKYQAPPSDITIGDVIVYHQSSCSDTEAHAVIVTDTSSGIAISCHSNDRKNANYDVYHSEFAYYEWLHYPS